MGKSDQSRPKASPEQIRYANLLFYGAWNGIFIMLVTYLIYIFGILKPYVPIHDVQKYWHMPVHEYIEQAHIPLGWGWVRLLNHGDVLNFVGIVLLGVMTIVCVTTLIPAYIKKKDWSFLVIVICEILVLCLAASGILKVGH